MCGPSICPCATWKSERSRAKLTRNAADRARPCAFAHCSACLPSIANGIRQVTAPGVVRMLFALYYVVAFTILILHFTGFLARRNLEWLLYVVALTVFPAVIYL